MGILKTYVKFHLIMMNIKDVKPVSKTCIFFIQYVTLVTASNNELFLYPATLKSAGYYGIPSVQKFAFECLSVRPSDSVCPSVSASFPLSILSIF